MKGNTGDIDDISTFFDIIELQNLPREKGLKDLGLTLPLFGCIMPMKSPLEHEKLIKKIYKVLLSASQPRNVLTFY